MSSGELSNHTQWQPAWPHVYSPLTDDCLPMIMLPSQAVWPLTIATGSNSTGVKGMTAAVQRSPWIHNLYASPSLGRPLSMVVPSFSLQLLLNVLLKAGREVTEMLQLDVWLYGP